MSVYREAAGGHGQYSRRERCRFQDSQPVHTYYISPSISCHNAISVCLVGKRDWRTSHYNMDFGDAGFFDDFYLKANQSVGESSVLTQNAAGDGTEGSSRSSESPKESGHRLCPTYAMNINSPMRHVHTRIYFTSESHIHALMNVLKYCRSKNADGTEGGTIKIDSRILDNAEYDYLSHLVFRLYENPQVQQPRNILSIIAVSVSYPSMMRSVLEWRFSLVQGPLTIRSSSEKKTNIGYTFCRSNRALCCIAKRD